MKQLSFRLAGKLMAGLALCSLASCATPETRIRTALVDAGLPKPMSACMADRIAGRLSLLQLNKLRGLSKLRDADVQKLTIEQFVKRTKSLQDPEILSAVTNAGIVCIIE